MGYMLETRGLTKRFGRGDQVQDAVADVSLHIREGEVYGLLGPNGAGKSTTLKMICGMLRPTAGEILFAGHAWRREDLYAIGSLIEEAPLYPNLTARENLRVRTTLLGLPESRVDEVLAAVDLADTGKKRAGRFSMGMRQRLGLALALIARPRLLVLDEPTNGLDPIGIEELRDQIRGFAAAGTTVIVSSHILSEVQQMADTIGIIYTTSEPNSVSAIRTYEELAGDYGFTIDAVGVAAQEEVTQAADTLISRGVDCLSNLTDNNVVGVLSAILEKTNEAGIPIYGSEVEQVKLGCVAGAGIDYVQLGIQTGLMAAKVLTGEATCSDMPYETIENYGLYINSDAIAAMGLTVPDDIASQAQECAE